MTRSTLKRWVLAASLLSGLSLATPPASAQESVLDELRTNMRSKPTDLGAALAYTRGLRLAGRTQEAMAQARSLLGLYGTQEASARQIQWEIARVHISRRDQNQAFWTCKLIEQKLKGPAEASACAAEVQVIPRRASEVHVEVASARKQKLTPDLEYSLLVSEGLAYLLELKEQNAETSLRDALRIRPEGVDALLALGRLLAQEGKGGVPELRKAVAAEPHHPDALYALGRALPPGDEAVKLFEQATKDRKGFADAYRGIAEVEMSRGKLAEAKKAAQEGLRIEPNDANSHIVMGKVSFAEGKFDDAKKSAESALAVQANSGVAKLLIADVYAKKKEIDLAIEAYQAAFSLDHTDVTPLVHGADACRANGRPTSAKAFAERATREFPEWGPAWIALGDALVSYGDPKSAKVAYEKAKTAKGPVDQAALAKKIADAK